MEERRPHEPCGASSILASATTSGRMSMDQTAAFGARRLCVRLAPLGPTIRFDPDRMHQRGDVAKWEGGVLQTLYGACSIHAVA